MSCYCDFDEAPDYFNQSVVRSKRAVKCFECGVDIPPGTPANLLVGRWNRGYDHFFCCQFCTNIANDLMDMGYCYIIGDLYSLLESIEEDYDLDEE
jgi:hypothetical protein